LKPGRCNVRFGSFSTELTGQHAFLISAVTWTQNPQGAHALRVHLQGLGFQPRTLLYQPAPANAGTKHLATAGRRSQASGPVPKLSQMGCSRQRARWWVCALRTLRPV